MLFCRWPFQRRKQENHEKRPWFPIGAHDLLRPRSVSACFRMIRASGLLSRWQGLTHELGGRLCEAI